MWIALRTFRYRGVRYDPGDIVPAEGWTNKRALAVTRRIRKVLEPSVEADTKPTSPSKMKRAELNEYAISLGIEEAEGFTNRDLLLAEVDKVLNPPPPKTGAVSNDSTDDEDDDLSAKQSTSEDDVTIDDDDVNPFADLDEKDEVSNEEEG